jgi:hypothetical protein
VKEKKRKETNGKRLEKNLGWTGRKGEKGK